MEELTIVLTPVELDYVCNSLADRPFREVNGLLQKILNQANSQTGAARNISPAP